MPTQLSPEQLLTKHITLLQALAATPSSLAQTLIGVDELTAHQAPASAEWSMADVVGHLLDIEARYRARLERVIQEERPWLPLLEPDETAHLPGTRLDELVDRFREARIETLAFLGERLPQEWQRPAIHQTRGETNFRLLVQNLIEHDTLHLHQLAELQQRLGARVEAGVK